MSRIINLYVSVFSSVTKGYQKNLKGEKVNCIRKKKRGQMGKKASISRIHTKFVRQFQR